MFFRTHDHGDLRSVPQYEVFLQAPRQPRLFAITDDGTYVASTHSVVLNGQKVAKFGGKIVLLRSLENMLVCADDVGSIKILKERVMRRYKIGCAVVDIQFITRLSIAVAGSDNILRIFELYDDTPIAKVKFGEKLQSIAHMDGVFALLTDKRIVFLDTVDFSETRSLWFAGNKLFFLDSTRLVVCAHNRMRVVDIADGSSTERRVHVRSIKKVVVNDGLIYTLGRDGYLKVLDFDLTIVEKHFLCDVTDVVVREKVYVSKASGEILCRKETRKAQNEEHARFDDVERMMKRYEYKGAFLAVLRENNAGKTYGILKYLIGVSGLVQALCDHEIGDLARIFALVNENWYVEECAGIGIEVVRTVLDSHRHFYAELVPFLNELSHYVTQEMLFQQECYIVASFIESLME